MKKYILLAIILSPVLAFSQGIQNSPSMEKQKVSNEEVQQLKSSILGNASRSQQTVYVDYPVADEIEQGVGSPTNFLWAFNSAYSAASDTTVVPINFIGVKLGQLIGYTDPTVEAINTYIGPFPYPNSLTVTVDSIFMLMAHENNSGTENKLYIDLRQLSAGGNFAASQPIVWTDSVVTTTALSPSGNWLGQNALYTLSMPCGYTTTVGQKVGIGLRYVAPKSDTLGVLASYISNPNGPAAPNDYALKSLFPYSTVRWEGFSGGNFVNTTNIFYNLAAGQTDTSWFRAQNWQIWAQLTFEDVTGIQETVRMPFGMDQNQPNPFSTSTQINYVIKDPQELVLNLFDVQGKLVITKNLGYTTQGTHSYSVDASQLESGTYFYKISGSKQESDMKKMIVVH
jgi:hypothetical protein